DRRSPPRPGARSIGSDGGARARASDAHRALQGVVGRSGPAPQGLMALMGGCVAGTRCRGREKAGARCTFVDSTWLPRSGAQFFGIHTETLVGSANPIRLKRSWTEEARLVTSWAEA